jgi:hypothetical protein
MKAKLFKTGGSQAVRLPVEFGLNVTKSTFNEIQKPGMLCFQGQSRHGISTSTKYECLISPALSLASAISRRTIFATC